MLDVLAPPLRILAMAAFLLLAKSGWFTWLTPENAHDIANQVMDFLVLAVPAAYALWAAYDKWRSTRPKKIIEKAAALKEVDAVVVNKPAIADASNSDKVLI